MKTLKNNLPTTLARRLAPEDLRPGDYVAVSRAICQLIPDGCTEGWGKLRTIDLPYIPYDAGEPLRVVGVCLPFVFVKTAPGGHDTLDTRRQTLVRLGKIYGKRAFTCMGPKKDRKKKAGKAKKKKRKKK